MIKYLRNKEAISGRLQDELVMMDIQKGKYFSLNPVATRIWELLDQPLTVGQLCELLHNEYDIEPEQCFKEVADYLTKMEEMGLVSIEE